MPERDGYIAGVPCWIDTNQPDPNAALPFYGGLFGWEFEDVMPEGSPGRYFIGRIRGGDVAAVGSAHTAIRPASNTSNGSATTVPPAAPTFDAASSALSTQM